MSNPITTTSMNPKIIFRLHAIKKNREERCKDYTKINEAVEALWKIRDVVEGFVTLIDINGGIRIKLVAKIGRRRGINIKYAAMVKGRPMLKKAGEGWQRLPSKFSTFEDKACDDS